MQGPERESWAERIRASFESFKRNFHEGVEELEAQRIEDFEGDLGVCLNAPFMKRVNMQDMHFRLEAIRRHKEEMMVLDEKIDNLFGEIYTMWIQSGVLPDEKEDAA